MSQLPIVPDATDLAAEPAALRQAAAARPRVLRSAAALLTVGLLLTGCAGTDGDSPDDQGSAATASGTQDGGTGDGGQDDDGSASSDKDGEADASSDGDDGADDSGGDKDGEDKDGEDKDGKGGAEESDSVDPADFPASNTTTLTHMETLRDVGVEPKSVVSNQHGLMIANNVVYQHNVVLFDTATRKVFQTLDDTVNPAELGVEGLPDEVSGAPVEATWTKDGEHAYVTQYGLYPVGTAPDDNCTAGSDIAPSLVYRYSVEEKDWDAAYRVGRVPKYLALSPDESRLLVTNWCDSNMTVIDTASGETEHTIPLDTMPRGIVVLPDNKTAYATAMWADKLYRVDLEKGTSEVVMHTGANPRHLTLSPDGKTLYMTLSGADEIVKMDAETGEVIASAPAGDEPRSMDISADGTALYVVNYYDSTVSKIDAETLEILGTAPAGVNTIGITYDKPSGEVWVANYGGTIDIYDDTDGAGPRAGGSEEDSEDSEDSEDDAEG